MKAIYYAVRFCSTCPPMFAVTNADYVALPTSAVIANTLR